MPSLFLATKLRVDVGGAPAIDGMTLATTATAHKVLVLGGAHALFEAAAGLRAATSGEVQVDGMTPPAALRASAMACAPLDPPLPARWTLAQYVTWSSRLAGHGRSEASAQADRALDRLQLTSSARARLGACGLSLRRAAVLAGALATDAPVLVLDDPLAALADDIARPLARLVTRALSDRRWLVFAPRMSLLCPLALAAEEALVIDGSEIAAQGPPAEIAAAERSLALRVGGDIAAFASAVEQLGARVVRSHDAPLPAYVRVDLGPLAARDLLRVAGQVHAFVLELHPISRPFA